MAKSKSMWVGRTVQKEDITKISYFRAIIEGGEKLARYRRPEYYIWKYFDNPFGCQYARIAEDGDQIVGLLSATCKRIKVGEQIINCAEIGDIFTHPEYRRQGIFTTLFKELYEELQDAGISLIYVRPNEKSYPILVSQFGFENLLHLKNLILPLHVGKILEYKMRLPLPHWLERIMDRLMGSTIYRIKNQSVSSNLTILPATRFDSTVNAVWESICQDHEVMVVRDKAYLNRRYIRNPTEYTVLIAWEEGKPVGFIITTSKQAQIGNLKTGHIVDMLFPEQRNDIAESLLIKAIDQLSREGNDLVFAWAIKHPSARVNTYYQTLKKLGFFSIGKDLNFVVRAKSLEARTISIIRAPTNWFLTMGDTDGI